MFDVQGDQPISWLMFFTLAAAIIIAASAFLAFLRSRHNREIASVALEGDGRARVVADRSRCRERRASGGQSAGEVKNTPWKQEGRAMRGLL
ncbi:MULTISPECIES: hypothetical protein [unclassified Bradyrhizobium]|uniref:hypothetical protein n=1 Tax=unclassified Bradyrhizobium TaxID=2631580 RepID=UPI0028ED4B92|nr:MULTISPECIES: hypothetical protein [unclassified Bradyrhizobium]